ncbi:Testis, prostate and placenta-expressed protein [Frankliniella fusca]|uniref:Testis, prostate and placenta-expressed protein n=1 Tax=Frankliniella fusca TaxID=407009 RepID=A0AAE1LLX5_9NEOP|nr:Testis, prostate and placenta-expressed protein [Frankliniella fusca]
MVFYFLWFQFVVVKFYGDEDDEVSYEVGLTGWLDNIVSEKSDGFIRWPPGHIDASKLVQKQTISDHVSWELYKVSVRKYYSDWAAANQGCNRRINDTAYETSTEEGRGRRNKKPSRRILDSSSDEETNIFERGKKKTKSIPPPPTVSLESNEPGKFVKSPLKMDHRPKIVVAKSQTACKQMGKLGDCVKAAEKTGLVSKVSHNAKIRDSNHLKIAAQKALFSEEEKRLKDQHTAEQDLLKKLDAFNKNKRTAKKRKSRSVESSGKKKKNLLEEEEDENVDDDIQSLSDNDSVCGEDVNSSPPIRIATSFPLKSNSLLDSQGASFSTPSKTINASVSVSETKTEPIPSSDSEPEKGSPSSLKRWSPVRPLESESESFKSKNESQKTTESVKRSIVNYDNSNLQYSQDSEDYPTLSKMYALQKQLNSKQDITAMAVERLCRFVLPGEKVLKRPSGLPAYPIETMSDMKNIEDFLSSDLNRSSTAMYMSKYISKDNFKKAVTTLLSKTIGKEVAKKYTFTGVGGKMSFEATKVWDMITLALLSKYPDDAVLEANAVAGKWLTNASYTRKQLEPTKSLKRPSGKLKSPRKNKKSPRKRDCLAKGQKL